MRSPGVVPVAEIRTHRVRIRPQCDGGRARCGAAGCAVKRLCLGSCAVALLALAAAAGRIVGRALRSLDEPLAVAAVRCATRCRRRERIFRAFAADLAPQGGSCRSRAPGWYARWKGLASAVKAGEYAIEPGLTPRSLLAKMVKGDVVLHSFTIVDGWRVRDLLAALRRNPDVAVTLARCRGQADGRP
jgi:UPF0755 protein